MKKTLKNQSKNEENFFTRVYDVVKLIPEGRVTTYGSIAKFVGSPQSSRMVGWAMKASHLYDIIPAHRVVNRNGILTGKNHFRHPDLMQQLLESEGIIIENDKIVNFKECYWDPYKELF